jgi:hypothetical protein
MIVRASWLSHPGTCWSAQRPVAGVGTCFDRCRVAVAEEEGVVVLLTAVQHHDARQVLAEIVDHGLHHLGHRRSDLDVVEAHVRVAAGGAGVEAVVLDDLDAGLLGLLDDRATRARVEARQQDHARTVGDGLLRLGLLRSSVALGVDDVVLDPGLVERFLEVLPVVGLPPGRAGTVFAGGLGGAGRLALLVVAATAGCDEREE